MNPNPSRRQFLQLTAASLAALSCLAWHERKRKAPLFKISLAEWSLNKALFAKKITNLDFPRIAKSDLASLPSNT
jgi:hypothetical protein